MTKEEMTAIPADHDHLLHDETSMANETEIRAENRHQEIGTSTTRLVHHRLDQEAQATTDHHQVALQDHILHKPLHHHRRQLAQAPRYQLTIGRTRLLLHLVLEGPVLVLVLVLLQGLVLSLLATLSHLLAPFEDVRL